MLIGPVLNSIVVSSITTGLLVVVVTKPPSLYGKTVSLNAVRPSMQPNLSMTVKMTFRVSQKNATDLKNVIQAVLN